MCFNKQFQIFQFSYAPNHVKYSIYGLREKYSLKLKKKKKSMEVLNEFFS